MGIRPLIWTSFAAFVDAIYLSAYFLVTTYWWLSYVVAIGLTIAVLCGKWLYRYGTSPWTGLLIAGLPVFPVSVFRIVAQTDIPDGRSLNNQSNDGQYTYIEKTTFIRRVSVRSGLLVALSIVLAGTATNFLGERLVNPALSPLDHTADTYLSDTFVTAGASYAAARTINRASSSLSNAQVKLPFLASAKPGKLLKPLQDMAVRLSDFMVLAMVSIGIQDLFLEVAQGAALPVLGSFLLATVLLINVVPIITSNKARIIFRSAVVLLVVFRLGVPIAASAIGIFSSNFLEHRRETANEAISIAETDIGGRAETSQEQGLIEKIQKYTSEASAYGDKALQIGDDAISYMVDLIVIYAVEVLIAPIMPLLNFEWVSTRGR